MANICESRISVVGLKELPETFVKALSKAMFGVDLDNMDLAQWGHYRCEDGKLVTTYRTVDHETGEEKVHRYGPNTYVDTNRLVEGRWYWDKNLLEISPETWYSQILKDRKDGGYPPLCVLVPGKPFVRCGVEVPRLYVETKWEPPFAEVKKASEAFPDLLFHLQWFIEQDGPSGEFVLQKGHLLETTRSNASWYLFDGLKYPSMSLLPKYMPLTLAQRGSAAIEDAIDRIKMLHFVIHHPGFTGSRYRPFGDQRKVEETTKAVDDLLGYMEKAAKSLTFEGVFLPDIPYEPPEMTEKASAGMKDNNAGCLVPAPNIEKQSTLNEAA
jgi:hypothetical protein